MRRMKLFCISALMVMAVTACGKQSVNRLETEKPETTLVCEQTPEISEEPKVTMIPEATKAPEVTKVPDENMAPEVTKAPDENMAPEVTQAPTQVPTKAPEPSHTHTFSQASCISAATCSCGVVNGEPLGHDFGDNNKNCARCGVENPNYVEAHVHEWVVDTDFYLSHTNIGHYAPYICQCGADFQTYEELDAHQEETAELSRTQEQWKADYSREDKSTWYIVHTGWCNGWIVEREWDDKRTHYTQICSTCGEKGESWDVLEEVTCTCVHSGPDMHFHFLDRPCCNSELQ